MSENVVYLMNTPVRPRYAIERSPEREFKSAHASNQQHAIYDIVDLGTGEETERVLASGRYEPALFIVGALNAQEELLRLAQEVPTDPAA